MPSANPSPPPSSFIPREMPVQGPAPRPSGRGLADLLVLSSVVLFVASAALAAGVFLYDQYLQSSAASKVDQLERAKAAFEPALIHELTRLDDRLRSASEILTGHMAPTAFFRMLEQNTIENVGFKTLNFESQDAQNMTIKMEGVAQSVNSIALQADLFSKGGVVTSPIFSNIDREVDGVHFSLSALLDPSSVNYVQLVGAAASALPASPQGSPFDAPAQGAEAPAPPPTPPASGGTNID